MSNTELREPLWSANPALTRTLALCPLLAMSHSVVTALGLGFVTLVVLLVSNVLVALMRKHRGNPLELLVWLIVIATAVAGAELLMQAFAWPLHQALGIYLPLIAANCLMLQRAFRVASRRTAGIAAVDALRTGGSLLAAMLLLGAVRELLGNGSVFAGMDLLFGARAGSWELQPFAGRGRFLVATLPPGAFLFAGFLLALKNLIAARRRPTGSTGPAPAPGSRRVRITGSRA
jgi:electron transport complex protein RnfE